MKSTVWRLYLKWRLRVKVRSAILTSWKYHLAPQVLPSVARVMIRRASVVLVAVLFVPGLSLAQSNPPAKSAGSQEQTKPDPKAKVEPKGQNGSLTGCVDEQEGQWVLVNDHDMTVIANLAADGFPTEGFAKHMGQKVTVRGTASSTGSRPLFKVRSIETVSETCTAR